MSGFDVFVLSAVGLTVAMGLWKGLAGQVFGIAGLILGYILSVRYYMSASRLLPDINPGTARIVAFLFIFISSIIAAYIVGRLLERLLKFAGLGWANRIMGGALGLIKGTLVIAVVMVVIVAFQPSDNRMLENSVTVPYIISVTKVLGAAIPYDIKSKYKKRIELFEMLRKQGVEE